MCPLKVPKTKNATGTFRSGSHRDLPENSGDVAVRPDFEPSDGNQLWLLLTPLHGACQSVEPKNIVLFQLIRKNHGNAGSLCVQISSRIQLKYCAMQNRAPNLGGSKRQRRKIGFNLFWIENQAIKKAAYLIPLTILNTDCFRINFRPVALHGPLSILRGKARLSPAYHLGIKPGRMGRFRHGGVRRIKGKEARNVPLRAADLQ